MRILVTGSAGFIGYHLVERLIAEGNEVVGIDNLSNYYDVTLKYGRLLTLGIDKSFLNKGKGIESSIHKNFKFFNVDISNQEVLNVICETERFDVIVNLAAQAGVRYSIENPHSYINSNILGFTNILECSKNFSIKHLVYASSSSVYGLNDDNVFSTEDSVNHPISLYAASKRSNELMAHVYSHLYKVPTTGLRFFTVYGPWGRPDMALFLFTKAILAGKPISVFNNGNMLRDFTYVDDVVEGIVRVIKNIPIADKRKINKESKPHNSSAPFALYNIGNSKPVRLLDFIEILEEQLNKKAIKNFLPLQPGDVLTTHADVSPLINELGYSPKTPLNVGIKVFVDWYRNFYSV